MKTVFLHELRFSRKSLIIWLVIILVVVAMGAAEYPLMVENAEIASSMVSMMPEVMGIMFGIYADLPINTAIGYFSCLFLWYCLMIFSHAAVTGANIISKEERDKTGEYLYTKPLSRQKINIAKFLSAIAQIFIIFIGTYLINFCIFVPATTDFSISTFTFLMLGMFFGQLIFMSIGIILSSFFRQTSLSVRISLLFVLAFYIISVIVEYSGIKALTILTPFWYFNAPDIVDNGITWWYLIPMVLIIAMSVFLMIKRYKNHDIYC